MPRITTSSIWRRIRIGIARIIRAGCPSNPQSYMWGRRRNRWFDPVSFGEPMGYKPITIRVTPCALGVAIAVVDNGVGIPTENMTRIFSHGFTTRPGGHGFGLHSAALAAQELKGSLGVASDGPGCGA